MIFQTFAARVVCQQCKSTCEDGVLADFDRGVVERTGNQPKELLDRKEETLETHRENNIEISAMFCV